MRIVVVSGISQDNLRIRRREQYSLNIPLCMQIIIIRNEGIRLHVPQSKIFRVPTTVYGFNIINILKLNWNFHSLTISQIVFLITFQEHKIDYDLDLLYDFYFFFFFSFILLVLRQMKMQLFFLFSMLLFLLFVLNLCFFFAFFKIMLIEKFVLIKVKWCRIRDSR